jgi:DNA-binding CsgD family transcriptional regulator
MADPDLGGASLQLRLFEEVLETVEYAAVPSGLLLVIEDLHWADPSSRGLFEFLSRNLRVAVALVGTIRTDEPDDAGLLAWLGEVQRGPRAVRIDLGPFGRDELAELVAGVLGRPASLELVSEVFERSAGNAFLAEELLAAREQGVVVPSTVRSLVVARVSGLSGPARDLVRLAAVAGVRMSHGLLAAAGGLDEDVLLAAARELVETHLLVADRSGQGYAFRHALTREAVYDDLLPGERRRLHRTLARALSDEPKLGPAAGWAVAQAIAEHWLAAGALDDALAASVAAGDAAREALAAGGALAHYEQVLDLWDGVADPETLAGVERPVLLERAAEAASGSGEHDRAIRYVDAAISELEDATAEPAQIGLLCERKARYLGWSGRMDEWAEWAGRAAALVPSEPSSSERARVLVTHANALIGVERYGEASRVATAGLEAARRAGARRDEARAHFVLGSSLAMTSTDPEAGIDEFEQALAVSREIGDTWAVVLTSANLAETLVLLGRLDEAAATALEAADIGVQSAGLRREVGLSLSNAANALFLGGRWDECQHALERLGDQRAGGWMEPWGLALAGLLDASRGRDDDASAAIAAAGNLGVVDADSAECALSAARAQISLNHRDLDAARHAVLDGLDMLTGSAAGEAIVCIVTLAALGLQIEADLAHLGRARRDPMLEQRAVEAARTVAAQTLALRADACAPAHRPEVMRAHRALCEAELGRAEGRSDPDLWSKAADTGAVEGLPYRTAYARFREAEAVLARRGYRARVVDLLTAAHAATRQLGAEPLRHEIEALARRARIELTAVPAAPPGPAEQAPTAFGLTSRELEVLRLLAAGYTNPQIGEALYVSRKTASHHVSSVLTKLGVSTRVEAAGVAHRLGLTPDTAAPK